jgi:hypothetical protein
MFNLIKRFKQWRTERNRPVTLAEIEAWIDSLDDYSASCLSFEAHAEYLAEHMPDSWWAAHDEIMVACY